jgi:hypothetical protein
MAHTAPTAPFVIHRTKTGEGVVKNSESIANGGVIFLSIIFLFSIGKARMNAPRLWKECLTGIG